MIPGKNIILISFTFFYLLRLIIPGSALSQDISGTFVMINPSPYVSDWETNSSMAILTIINSKRTMEVKVQAKLNKDGQPVSSVLSGDITRINGPSGPNLPPVTTVFRSNQIAKWSGLKFTGEMKESVIRTGRLPEGNYEVCIEIVQSDPLQGETLSKLELCSQFNILLLAQPPVLILPQDNSEIDKNNLIFQWTPVTGVKDVIYKLKIVELTVRGFQTPEQAMKSNLAFYEAELRSTSFIYPPAAKEFAAGKEYAWQIQATDKDGNPVALNEGKSEIASYKIRGDLIILPPKKKLPDTLIANSFKIVVEQWDASSKSVNPLLPSGIGRIKFKCSSGIIVFPWGDLHLIKKKFFVVEEIDDSVSQLQINEAKFIKKNTEIGDELELEVPEKELKKEMILDRNVLINVFKKKSPDGIRVAFRDVKWDGPAKPAVILTEGFGWYPTMPPVPEPPAEIDISPGFKLEIDSIFITPAETKVKGSVLLPKSIISDNTCTYSKLPLPLTTITSDCEFYSSVPDSAFGKFYIGETDIIIQGTGYVLDFSSSQSAPGIIPPLLNSWKGVVLKNGETPAPISDSIINNRGYVKAEYDFTNGLITSSGLAAKLTLKNSFTFYSLEPFGYEMVLPVSPSSYLNLSSSAVSGGQFVNAVIKLPEKSVRNAAMSRIETATLTLSVQPDMDLFGDVKIKESLAWGEFSKTEGTPKFYQLDNELGEDIPGNFYLGARYMGPFYPLAGSTFVTPSFSPANTQLEAQSMQGVTFYPINNKKFTIWTKDLPASDTANGVVFKRELVIAWMNVIRTGVHSEVRINLREDMKVKLGPTWSDKYKGIDPFDVSYGMPKKQDSVRFMKIQFVESAVWDADFRGDIMLKGGIKDTLKFKNMIYTSTANNAGGEVDLSAPMVMDYWGVLLVPKDPTKSAGTVCVKLGVIYLTAAGIFEPVHYKTPFFLTWGEIKATGDLGRLYFDYNNVGQQFDKFYYTPYYVELSKFNPGDSGLVQTYGSLSINFFGSKMMSISDYKSGIPGEPFLGRYVTVRPDAFMDAGPSDLHWIRSWAGSLANLDFIMRYDTLMQNGFVGVGFVNLLGITGNMSARIRVNSEGSCFSVYSEFAEQFNFALINHLGIMGNAWGCGCIKGEVLEQIVIGGELSISAGVGGSILARAGSLVSIIFSYRPTRTMLEVNGDMYIVVATVNFEVTALAIFTFDRGAGYVEGYLKGTMNMDAVISGVSGEGELDWHMGVDYQSIQGRVAVQIYGLWGGVGVESGIFLGIEAPKDKVWIMDGIDGRFGLNKTALPSTLTGFYAYMSVTQAVTYYVLSGGYQVYVGMGAFISFGDPSFALVGNVGVRIWGEFLGGLLSASASGNLQLILGLPSPGFQGTFSVEACALWVACVSASVSCGYNNTDTFYLY